MNPLTTSVYRGDTGTNTLTTRTLTADGVDRYTITKSGGTITASAPMNNHGSNLRRVIWPAGTPDLADTRVCATWATRSVANVQEGIAHRILTQSSRTRAITVTKNVWADCFWAFNVHTWDTARPEPFIGVAQFEMDKAVFQANGLYRPLPWRACSQVAGNTLWFKIWFPDAMGEPPWDDETFARTTELPADWNWPGKSGWYVGHLPPGGSVQYNDLEIWR